MEGDSGVSTMELRRGCIVRKVWSTWRVWKREGRGVNMNKSKECEEAVVSRQWPC